MATEDVIEVNGLGKKLWWTVSSILGVGLVLVVLSCRVWALEGNFVDGFMW